MRLVILEAESLGKDMDLSGFSRFGEVTVYEKTTEEECPERVREADIVIAAAGKRQMFGREYFRPGQIILDVGIHFDENGKMCGDVRTDEAGEAKAVTPVPGGIGSVTTAVLMNHVAEAAGRQTRDRKTE